MPKKHRTAAARMLIVGSIIGLAIAAAGALGNLRINLTPSEPLGFWRIVPLDRPVRNSDRVFICPPDDAAMRTARGRGYLRFGLCEGGYAPLIKTVIAGPGQHVSVADSVRVDGRAIEASRVRTRDGKGRPLNPNSGGVVPPGMVFLHSSFSASFDSRYFGPLPSSGILGLAQPVLTYAP
ncbi:MAG: conjugative transfer signal peptidase TraF [Hyphomicrobiales bacterium]|nr:conjugative transfer signal peptidase TraF [Hyphomicrobiales bacterium]